MDFKKRLKDPLIKKYLFNFMKHYYNLNRIKKSNLTLGISK